MIRAVIAEVQNNSLAHELGLVPGDSIIKVNEHTVRDLIEFQYEWAGEEVLLEVGKKSGEPVIFEIEKDYDEALGVVFTQAVFDGLKQCRNKCIFCFVEQMPEGLRKSLYVKDDDYRLSFLQGSYITLTNLSKQALQRIKEQHLTPLYVSVHTTQPGLRVQMMGAPDAGDILKVLKELSGAGIEFHTQVVLCPGINDGDSLEQTYHELANIDGVRSLAVVPVGLTKYRDKLSHLDLVNRESAAEIVDWAAEKQQTGRLTKGSAFVWLSDEFYLTAERPLPSFGEYEDFPQLENGVGMARLLLHEFEKLDLPGKVNPAKEIVFLTGMSGAKVLLPIVDKLNTVQGLKITLLSAENSFFGASVTVAGLLTGTCLLSALRDIEKGSIVFIPAVMLRELDGKFLDDLSPRDIEKKLSIRLIPVPVSAADIVSNILTV